MATPSHSLNLRLGKEAYDALKAVSTQRGISMNKAAEESILAAAVEARKERLRQAFARLAEDESGNDVEFAWDAQREAVLAQE